MHGGMTRRHEGCVSTMLTESGLSIASAVRDFKAPVRPKAGCKPTITVFRVFFVLNEVMVASSQYRLEPILVDAF